jgi:hypothetical protein
MECRDSLLIHVSQARRDYVYIVVGKVCETRVRQTKEIRAVVMNILLFVTAKDKFFTLSPVFRECLKHLLDICICDSLHSRFKCSSRNKSADGACAAAALECTERAAFQKFHEDKKYSWPPRFLKGVLSSSPSERCNVSVRQLVYHHIPFGFS